MIMVDELRPWPGRAAGQAGRHFGNGKSSCHMTTDGPVDDLHAFARKIGLKREWFQPHAIMPHYDLTPGRRARALSAGAEIVLIREQLLARQIARSLAALLAFAGAERDAQLREDFVRASGDVDCGVCGRTYWGHVTDVVHPWLHVLCDGRRVKL